MTNIRHAADLTGTGSVTLECPGFGACGIQVAGTWVGTLVFEVSITKDTWVALNVFPPNSTTAVTGATTNGLWAGSIAGFQAIRVRCSAFTSGIISVVLLADPVSSGGSGGAGGGGGGGDASAANQLLEIAELEELSANALDYDTGAGTDPQVIFGIALPASGGPVAGGTSTNPIRTDPTGTTTQPVSAATLPLPSGAATAAKQDTGNTSLASIDGKLSAGLGIPAYDYVSLTVAATTDTYVFKTGGAGGSTVATITITYTDSTKVTISTVVKT